MTALLRRKLMSQFCIITWLPKICSLPQFCKCIYFLWKNLMAWVKQKKMKTNEQQVIPYRSEFNQHKNKESICKVIYVTFQNLRVVTIDSAPKALKVIFIEIHNHMFIICFVQIKLPELSVKPNMSHHPSWHIIVG